MQTISTAFEQELTKLIETEMARLTGNLVFGGAIFDFADYKHTIGRLAGLRLALDQFEAVNTIISER